MENLETSSTRLLVVGTNVQELESVLSFARPLADARALELLSAPRSLILRDP